MSKDAKLFLTVEFQLVSVKGMMEILFKKNHSLAYTIEMIKAKNHQWMLMKHKNKIFTVKKYISTKNVLITKRKRIKTPPQGRHAVGK